MNLKRSTPRHIVVKIEKIKDKESKCSKGKSTSYIKENFQLTSQWKLSRPKESGRIHAK